MRIALVVSMFLAACGGSPKSAPMAPAPANEVAPAAEEPSPTEDAPADGANGGEGQYKMKPNDDQYKMKPSDTMNAPAPSSTEAAPTAPPAKNTRAPAKKPAGRTGDPCAGGE